MAYVKKRISEDLAVRRAAKCADQITSKIGFIRSMWLMGGGTPHCMHAEWDTVLRKIGLSRDLDPHVKSYITGTLGLPAPQRKRMPA